MVKSNKISHKLKIFGPFHAGPKTYYESLAVKIFILWHERACAY